MQSQKEKGEGGKMTLVVDDSAFIQTIPTSSFVRSGGELQLSNLGQLELLRATVERGVPFRTTVRGFSMAPFIRDEDLLTIAPMNGRSPRVGEIVAVVSPDCDRLVIHRVIARVDDDWMIRGDNCAKADGIVPREKIIGRVIRVERNGRMVRGGLGAEALFIAWLQRSNLAPQVKKLYFMPRIIAAAFLHRGQGWAMYRALGRRLSTRVLINTAGDEDMAPVYSHFNSDESLRSETHDPNVTNYVAKRRGEIIGFAQLVRHPATDSPWVGYWLFSLEVWGRYRGLGIGQRLTQRVIAQAVAESATDLLLAVFEDNARAICLYHKLGFGRVTLPALEPQFAGDQQQFGRRRIVMRKRLTTNR